MPSSNTQPHKSLEVATVSLPEKPSWQIKLLYDGECPLCVREVNFLRKRDA
ncbi:MAG TPA: DCC1-like thiol-disulfide oxidoreductase family protein, partial [Coleofasciculaceae cyanobacterium]